MNNEELQGKAVQYALGTMPDNETGEFETHLREDRALQQLVHEWQEVNEIDAKECPEVEVPFQVFSGIADQIENRNGTVARNSSKSSGGVVSFMQWGGWAVAACAAVAFALFGSGGKKESADRDSLVAGIILKEMGKPGAERLSASTALGGREDRMQDRMVELAELAEAYWDSRDVGQGDDAADGFTVFDPEFEIGFIAVENLPKRVEGKSYHVWARSVGDESPVRAGSLPVGKSSFGMFYFDISSKPGIDAQDENLSFFVTEEATTDPAQPEGRVVLSGI